MDVYTLTNIGVTPNLTEKLSQIVNELPNCSICALNSGSSPLDYQIYNYILIGIMLPALGTFGVIGNALAFYGFTRKALRNSANTYLACLAISDTCVVTTSVFIFTFEALRAYYEVVLEMYLGGIKTVFPIATMAQTMSVYLTVAAGIDGLVAVCFRQFKKYYCRPVVAGTVITLVLIFAVSYNVPKFMEVIIVRCFDHVLGQERKVVCATPLRQHPLYNQIYYVYLYSLIMIICPLVTLFIIAFIIVTAVSVRNRRKRFLIPSSAPSSIANVHLQQCMMLGDDDDPIVLIMVVILFIACNILGFVINLLEAFANLGNSLSYLVDLSNFLVVFNSSVNVLIYLKYSLPFRTKVVKLIKRLGHKLSGKPTNNGNVNRQPQNGNKKKDYINSTSPWTAPKKLPEDREKIAEPLLESTM